MSTITATHLDAAKTANYDRGYREGFEAAMAGHPYGSDPRVGVLGKTASVTAPSPIQTAGVSWGEIAASVNAERSFGSTGPVSSMGLTAADIAELNAEFGVSRPTTGA